MASRADEGRVMLRKASMRRIKPQESEVSEWGNLARFKLRHPAYAGGEPSELKHLSRTRRREDSASSGERKRNSPNRSLRRSGLQDSWKSRKLKSKDLGRSAAEGESPVDMGGSGDEYPEYHGRR